jgi:hypothetical protein
MSMVGLERAIIVAVDDSQERARYRVRILRLHDEAIPVAHLPWAEMLTHAGRGWGDVPHYEIDDLVWVDFEGGDRELPVLVGGWIAAPKGKSDLPSEQTEDYTEDRRRWVKKDRAGNLIEVSEKEGELHVRIKSGDAELVISQEDNSFKVVVSGPATIEAEGNALVKAGGTATVEAVGDATVKSGGAVKIEAASQVSIDPKCVVGGGSGKVLTDEIIPVCLFAGSPFSGAENLKV